MPDNLNGNRDLTTPALKKDVFIRLYSAEDHSHFICLKWQWYIL